MKTRLKKLVSQEKLDQVLELLLEQLEHQNPELYNTGINLSGRYQQWKERTLKGIQESHQEINIIRESLIQLIDKIDATSTTQETSKSPSGEGRLLHKIKAHLGIQSDDAALLIYVLVNSNFKWRKQKTITAKTGWTNEQLDAIARNYPEFIKRYKREDEVILFSIKEKYSEGLNKLIAE